MLESCTKLREAFRVAVSEAKLAQAQSLAASRDVHSLKMDLERSKRVAHEEEDQFGGFAPRGSHRPAPRGAGGAKAVAAASGETQVRGQLQAQKEHLRQLEASLRQELQDVSSQMLRLRTELQRRQQRAATACGAAEALTPIPISAVGFSSSPVKSVEPAMRSPFATGEPRSPLLQSAGSKDCSRIAAKFLTSSRVLPEISSPPRHGTSGSLTARARLETVDISPGRSRTAQSNLPNLPWRAGTAP